MSRMPWDRETVPVEGRIVRWTDRAVEMDFDDEELVWLPLSQLDDFDPEDHGEGAIVTLHLPEWLANREGLI